jgi:hypothetical protein
VKFYENLKINVKLFINNMRKIAGFSRILMISLNTTGVFKGMTNKSRLEKSFKEMERSADELVNC